MIGLQTCQYFISKETYQLSHAIESENKMFSFFLMPVKRNEFFEWYILKSKDMLTWVVKYILPTAIPLSVVGQCFPVFSFFKSNLIIIESSTVSPVTFHGKLNDLAFLLKPISGFHAVTFAFFKISALVLSSSTVHSSYIDVSTYTGIAQKFPVQKLIKFYSGSLTQIILIKSF
ncbi:hypothetical protein AGLY_009878 [Aphis glycines]|uniref:Uncharacterized protein n=1 Tax=Aphis glycines TaxID=307491 RepID=A0A6G0TH34_APHGL|nr:hypothetical protein AGLY_009878 [Aphis glycines]